MTDTFIELSEDEFDAQYPLRTNHLNSTASWAYGEGAGCLFETYGEELAFVRRQNPLTVWTFIDGDDGDQYVLSGFHLVNRIGYLISTVPVPEGTNIHVHIPMHPEEAAEAATHTPEPWRIHRLNSGWPVITGDAHDIADLRMNGRGMSHVEANARRIVAAVNACKGLSTKALERGIVAQLRHVLGELLTAAGDLDAAINGATDEFDDERGRMNAAIRAAQFVLNAGTEINVHELLAGRGQIAHIWGIEDVQEVRPDLSEKQAWQVLQDVERGLDSQYGICWDTIEIVADELFGPAPETAAEEE